jgi:hypothetical protein
MLLTSLSFAKKKVVRTVCVNNQKGLLLATHLYALDNTDYLPGSNDGNLPGWACDATDWTSPPDFPSQLALLKNGQLYKYITGPGIYMCPSDKTNMVPFSSRPEQVTSYIMNNVVDEYGERTTPFRLVLFHGNQQILFFEPDENGPFDISQPGLPPCAITTVTSRHGADPVGQFDGSVSFINQKQWFAEQGGYHKWAKTIPLSALPNRLWCNPDTYDGADEKNPRHGHVTTEGE